MEKTEKKEIIEVFEKMIKFIESHLYGRTYLCNMIQYIGVYHCQELQKCGFNDRMIPLTVEYLKSQRPTKIMNKVIYDKSCYSKINSATWWIYTNDIVVINGNIRAMLNNKDVCIMINTEKIDFLKHLINKLKK